MSDVDLYVAVYTCGWDACDSTVVAARTEEDAKRAMVARLRTDLSDHWDEEDRELANGWGWVEWNGWAGEQGDHLSVHPLRWEE